MTDYKELCAALREEADWCKAIEWEIPICTEDHIREAADMIEQLAAKCERLEKMYMAFMEDFKTGYEQQIQKKYGLYRCDMCIHRIDSDVGKLCPKDCDGYKHWKWKGIHE